MKRVFLLIGCPGSGKTWTTSQLTDKFHLVHHDLYIGMSGAKYVSAIIEAAKNTTKNILAEAPFSISQIRDPLERAGLRVVPVFIIEKPEVIASRYMGREKKPIPPGHLTAQKTYLERARLWRAFHGTASQCLEHLKNV